MQNDRKSCGSKTASDNSQIKEAYLRLGIEQTSVTDVIVIIQEIFQDF
jgi:hypothetical protein